jgi:antirestriction protein ArdC
MKAFSFFRKQEKTADSRPDRDGAVGQDLPFLENITIFNSEPLTADSYLFNAWVSKYCG